MRSRIKIFLLLALMTVMLSACTSLPTNVEELFAPPHQSDREKDVILKTVQEYLDGEYILKTPRTGDEKSAVIKKDMDADGVDEYVVFCYLKDSPNTLKFLIIDYIGVQYIVHADVEAFVDSIEYVVFDSFTVKNSQDILICWNTRSGKKQIQIYRYNEMYAEELVCNIECDNAVFGDMDKDGTKELFAVQKSSDALVGTVYKFDEEYVDFINKAEKTIFTGNSSEYNLIMGKLDSTGDSVAVVDFLNENAQYRTTIIWWNENDGISYKNMSLLNRAERLFSQDIDDDGIIEFPIVLHNDGATLRSEQLALYVTWVEYDKTKDFLTSPTASIVNLSRKYCCLLPRVYRNGETVSWSSETILSISDDRTAVKVRSKDGALLLEIRIFSPESWGNSQSRSYEAVKTSYDKVYAVMVGYENDIEEFGLDIQKIKKGFKIIE